MNDDLENECQCHMCEYCGGFGVYADPSCGHADICVRDENDVCTMKEELEDEKDNGI